MVHGDTLTHEPKGNKEPITPIDSVPGFWAMLLHRDLGCVRSDLSGLVGILSRVLTSSANDQLTKIKPGALPITIDSFTVQSYAVCPGFMAQRIESSN